MWDGTDCRTRLARPNSQARTGTGKHSFSLYSGDHEQGWQPYPVDPSLAIICDDHTYIHTYMYEYTHTYNI